MRYLQIRPREVQHDGHHILRPPCKYLPHLQDQLKLTNLHQDPSIFTVLAVPSEVPGESIIDIVCFGRRWLVMEESYRPPYYHRNTMSEFAFIVEGGFDVAPVPSFLNGLFVLTNSMTAHGADENGYKEAITEALKPVRVSDKHMGVMFESKYIIGTTNWAEETAVHLPHSPPNFKKAKI
jgi:homogentisate 1,2-dioxygenase